MTDASEGIDLDELRRLAEAATSGPWHWAGNTDTGEPYLATWIKGAGRCQVLSIGHEERSTTGRAADKVRSDAKEFDLGDPDELVDQWAHDSFGEPVKEPRLQFMTDLMCVDARDLAVYEVAPQATSREDPKVYRADVAGIRHPDAEFIAAADPQTVLALIARAESAERRIEKVRAFHGPFRYYEHEDSCPNTDEDHRAERHVEFEVGEYYCADMPTGDVVCDHCRDEDGERVDWPCETVKALTEGDKQ